MWLSPARTAENWTEFPPEIAGLLATNDLTTGAVPLLVIPDHQVPLAGHAVASHLDLWTLARTPRGLLSIAIEQRADQWVRPAPGTSQADTPSERRRLEALWSLLEIDRDVDPAISCRLIHRSAATLVEARRFFAIGAAVIVRGYGGAHDSFADFQRFVTTMGGRLRRPGHLLSVKPREGIELAFGWAQV